MNHWLRLSGRSCIDIQVLPTLRCHEVKLFVLFELKLILKSRLKYLHLYISKVPT